MTPNKRLAEIMTRNPVTVFEEDNVLHALEKLENGSFHHLPVVDGEKLVGLLSPRDVLRATVAGLDRSAFARAREARYLEQTFVSDIMQSGVIAARGEDTLQRAAQQMLEHHIGALPVVDADGNLLGIVTESDLVRQLAEMG